MINETKMLKVEKFLVSVTKTAVPLESQFEDLSVNGMAYDPTVGLFSELRGKISILISFRCTMGKSRRNI